MMIDLKQLIKLAIEAAYEAGDKILKIYHSSDFEISTKNDKSPLTLADKRANDIISEKLSATKISILSEEGVEIPYNVRKNWKYYWLIDPLDGTKEFIKKNDEFTVNIALINEGKPILGVVYAPALNLMYYGSMEDGAYKIEDKTPPIKLTIPLQKDVNTIVASRSHINEETKSFISNYPTANIISMGSSLKFMLIAENKAQLYPRFSPTMEWDTAAAQAIVEAAGGVVLTFPEMKPLSYNRVDSKNGAFLVK